MISGSPIRWKRPPQRSFLHNPWLSRCTTNDCWSTARLWAQVSDLTTRTATVQTWNQCLLITNTTIIPQSKRHDLCFSELVCDMEMFKLIGSWCCYSVQVLGILLKPSKKTSPEPAPPWWCECCYDPQTSHASSKTPRDNWRLSELFHTCS